MKWPSRRVVALPRSWRRRRGAAREVPSRRPRRPPRASGRARRRGPPSTAAPRGARRARAGSRPGAQGARESRIAPDGVASSARMRISSSRTRSAETASTVGAASRIARSVAGSIVSSSRPANRAARIRRRASSAKRSRGSPTARRTRASRSDWPPTGSTSVPRPASRSSGSHAIALIVKSRRARSSVSDTPKRTSSGRRRSRYVPSARYEVTSTTGSGADRDGPEPVLPGRAGKRERPPRVGRQWRRPTRPDARARGADHAPRPRRSRPRGPRRPACGSPRARARGRSGKTSSAGMTRSLGPRPVPAADVDRRPRRSS